MSDEWRPIIVTPQEAMELAERGEEPQGDEEFVFVSWDMRLKDGLLADRDRRIFNEIREGKVIQLNAGGISGPVTADIETERPEDVIGKIESLISKATARAEATPRASFPIISVWVDAEAALFIRHLRVEERGTWRYVAGHVAERYGMDWGEDQPTGMELCEVAARFFGEDFMEAKDGWN